MKIIRISVMLLVLASFFACTGTNTQKPNQTQKEQDQTQPTLKVKAKLTDLKVGSYTLNPNELADAASNAGFPKVFEKTNPANVKITAIPEQGATVSFIEGNEKITLNKTPQTVKIKVSKADCNDATYTLLLSKKEEENTPPPPPKPKAKLIDIQVGSYMLKSNELTDATSDAGFPKVFKKTEPANVKITAIPEQGATVSFIEGNENITLNKTPQRVKIKVSKADCDDATYTLLLSKEEEENTPPPPPTPETYQPSAYEAMIDVTAPESGIVGRTFNSANLVNDGVFLNGRTVKLSKYQIAKYELTYKVWYEIVQWAKTKGYVFYGEAREAFKNATKGAAPTQEDLPVTFVNWFDAIVWCNAYTERRMGEEHCVYKLNDKSGNIIKDATQSGLADKVFWDQEKKGFRLASEAEWEFAARWQKDNSNKCGREYGSGVLLTKINHVSGANTDYTDTSNLEEAYKKYCWFEFNPITAKANSVGKLNPNAYGIHDMSGNLQEWVYDWYVKSKEKTETVENPMGPKFAEAGESGLPQKVLKGGWYRSISVAQCLPASRNGRRTPVSNSEPDCTIRLACYK